MEVKIQVDETKFYYDPINEAAHDAQIILDNNTRGIRTGHCNYEHYKLYSKYIEIIDKNFYTSDDSYKFEL